MSNKLDDIRESAIDDGEICQHDAAWMLEELSTCAAGPWRYDVDNAPKDGTNLLIAWKWLSNIQVDRLFWSQHDEFWTDGSGIRCCVMPDTVFAWTTINPPKEAEK